MDCVRPSCAGAVPEGAAACVVCGLVQRARSGHIEVAGPVEVTYRVFPDEKRTIPAVKVDVSEHHVTVVPVTRGATIVFGRSDLRAIEPPQRRK